MTSSQSRNSRAARMTRYSTGSIWVRHSCTSEATLRMPCTGSRILPKAEGRAAAACAGAPLRRGAEEPGFFRGGGVGDGSSAKKAELSTSTVRSAALRLLRFTRRRERLESSFIGNLLLSARLSQPARWSAPRGRAGRWRSGLRWTASRSSHRCGPGRGSPQSGQHRP